MNESEDISNLFARFGGQPEQYQEITRSNSARASRSRWPLLASVDVQAFHAPCVAGQARDEAPPVPLSSQEARAYPSTPSSVIPGPVKQADDAPPVVRNAIRGTPPVKESAAMSSPVPPVMAKRAVFIPPRQPGVLPDHAPGAQFMHEPVVSSGRQSLLELSTTPGHLSQGVQAFPALHGLQAKPVEVAAPAVASLASMFARLSQPAANAGSAQPSALAMGPGASNASPGDRAASPSSLFDRLTRQ